MDPKDLEGRLGCTRLIDELESRFDSQNLATLNGSPLRTLRRIKLFLRRNRELRKRITRNSKLGCSDCLTLSTLTALLARRKGVDADVAVPRGYARLLHAVVVYRDGEGTKTFSVAGKTRPRNPRIISPQQIETRLKVTSPVLRVFDSVGSLVRKQPSAVRRKRPTVMVR